MADLEEHTLEQVSDRCEECGVKLTDAELAAAMESGGPALCTVHATETVSSEELDEPESAT